MSEDAYGNKVYRCSECSVDFIEGFDEERMLCDECAASIDEEGRQENIGTTLTTCSVAISTMQLSHL